jgi:hypothetical protein
MLIGNRAYLKAVSVKIHATWKRTYLLKTTPSKRWEPRTQRDGVTSQATMDYTAAKDSKLACVFRITWPIKKKKIGALLPYLISAMVALSRGETS